MYFFLRKFSRLYPQFVICKSDYNLIFLEAFTRFLSLLFALLGKVHIEKPWICLLSLWVKEGKRPPFHPPGIKLPVWHCCSDGSVVWWFLSVAPETPSGISSTVSSPFMLSSVNCSPYWSLSSSLSLAVTSRVLSASPTCLPVIMHCSKGYWLWGQTSLICCKY